MFSSWPFVHQHLVPARERHALELDGPGARPPPVGRARDQAAVRAEEEALERGHRGLEVGHAEGHPVPGARPAELKRVGVPALLELLPHVLADAAGEPGLAGQGAGHPGLAPATIARAEQGSERQQARARPVDEPERSRVVAIEALAGGAVGHHCAHHEHQRHHHERPGEHDQGVAPRGPEGEHGGGSEHRRVRAGPAVQVGAKEVPPAAVRVRRGGVTGPSEGDARNRALGRHLDLEEVPRAEGHRSGDQERGEHLDARVVGLHVGVVVPARRLDLVLDLGELALELLVALRRAQLGRPRPARPPRRARW